MVSSLKPGDRVRVPSFDPGERWFMASVISVGRNHQALIEREDDKRRGLWAVRECILNPDAPYGATCKEA